MRHELDRRDVALEPLCAQPEPDLVAQHAGGVLEDVRRRREHAGPGPVALVMVGARGRPAVLDELSRERREHAVGVLPGVPGERDPVHLPEPEARLLQAVLDRPSRKEAMRALEAGEALLLGEGDEPAVPEQARARVLAEGDHAEDVHRTLRVYSLPREGAPPTPAPARYAARARQIRRR